MHMRALAAAAIVAVTANTACAKLGGSDKQAEMDEALRALASGSRPPYAATDTEGAKLWKQTGAFYEKRQYAAAWVEDAKPRAQMEDLIEALREAEREGLDPDLYSVSRLEERHEDA